MGADQVLGATPFYPAMIAARGTFTYGNQEDNPIKLPQISHKRKIQLWTRKSRVRDLNLTKYENKKKRE